jgi:hypothetical protein
MPPYGAENFFGPGNYKDAAPRILFDIMLGNVVWSVVFGTFKLELVEVTKGLRDENNGDDKKDRGGKL